MRSTFIQREIDVNATSNQRIDTSQTSFCSFSILSQKIANALKNIMHLKINNYAIDEITEKRTFSKDSKKSMSSFLRQRSVNVVQVINSQINNAFDVLRNRSNLRIKFELTFTQKTKNAQKQFTFKFKNRSSNNRKTTKSSQNEELWRAIDFVHIAIQRTKWKEWHDDIFFNRFENRRIWFTDNSKILTQRLCIDVV
jgi:hypothetical protein